MGDECLLFPTITDKQRQLICKVRGIMPENFAAHTSDEKILLFAELVLTEINVAPPLTNFTTASFPDRIEGTLLLGIHFFSMLFFQMRATLEDFNYNDNGLSVAVDQTAKIGSAITNMKDVFENQVMNFKKTEIFQLGGAGLGTPRFQSQIGQFLKIALGSAFTWNSA